MGTKLSAQPCSSDCAVAKHASRAELDLLDVNKGDLRFVTPPRTAKHERDQEIDEMSRQALELCERAKEVCTNSESNRHTPTSDLSSHLAITSEEAVVIWDAGMPSTTHRNHGLMYCCAGSQTSERGIMPAQLRSICEDVDARIRNGSFLTSVELRRLSDAAFGVTEGEAIDRRSMMELYTLVEGLRAAFKKGTIDDRDGKFRYEYVALLGIMQNQRIFDQEQEANMHAWIQEALETSRRPKHIGPLPMASGDAISQSNRSSQIAQSNRIHAQHLTKVCQLVLAAVRFTPTDVYALNEAIFFTKGDTKVLLHARARLLQLADMIRNAHTECRYLDNNGSFWYEYVSLLCTLQNQPIFNAEQRNEFHIRIREALVNGPNPETSLLYKAL